MTRYAIARWLVPVALAMAIVGLGHTEDRAGSSREGDKEAPQGTPKTAKAIPPSVSHEVGMIPEEQMRTVQVAFPHEVAANEFLRVGNLEAAEAELRQAWALYQTTDWPLPVPRKVRKMMAELFLRQGKNKEVLEVLSDVKEPKGAQWEHPDMAWLHKALASVRVGDVAFAESFQPETSIDRYYGREYKVSELLPKRDTLIGLEATILIVRSVRYQGTAGRSQDSFDDAAAAGRAFPNNPIVHYILASRSISVGNYVGAEQHLLKAHRYGNEGLRKLMVVWLREISDKAALQREGKDPG